MNSVTIRALLVRGMIAGVLAGLPAFGLAALIGEPQVDAAIAFEESHSHEHGGAAPVSRAVQATAGLGTAVLVYGTAIGGITALVLCFALGRAGRFRARATAALVAGGGFLTVALLPFLKYPANPPAVGDPATLDKRTALYFLMIALSVLLASGAIILGKRLAGRLGNWNATVAAATAFVVVVGLAMAFLPAGEAIPEGFPGGVLWHFRLASIAIQALLWTGLGLILGHLAERALEPAPATSSGTGQDTVARSAAAH